MEETEMRKWITRFLFLGLAALPSSAWAQYPMGNYPYYQPVYGQPVYGQPVYGQPFNGQPVYGQPVYSQQVYSQPVYGQPVYSQPVYPPPYQGAIIEAPQGMRPAMPMQPPGKVVYQMAPTKMKPATEPIVRMQAVELPAAKAAVTAEPEPKAAPAKEQSAAEATTTPAATGSSGITLIPPATTTAKDDAVNTAKKPVSSALFPSTAKDVVQTLEPIPAPAANFVEACEANKHCFVVFGDYLYWNVHGADVPYAQPFDGVIPGLSVPRGPVAVASPKFNSGFRAGGGMVFDNGNSGFFGTFTYFRDNRHTDTAAPDPFVLHNFLAFPNTASSAVDSLSASVDYHIQLYMADFDYKCAIVNNQHLYLNWLAGIRYAHLDQNLSSNFFVTGATSVNSDINFDGIGPRFGLDGRYQVCGGLYGYAQGIVDLLFGQFRGNYTETNVFTGLVGQTSINANRVVPILELEMGLGWQSAQGGFRVQGGYYVGSWFNTITTSSFASSIGATNFTTNGNNFRDNMTFDGLVLRFMFSY
jgi:hypothetical protein